MNVKQRSVFYCDHCRKHGLSRHAMESHERICTLNPDRVCRWQIDDHPVVEVARLATEIRDRASLRYEGVDETTCLEQTDIDWLRGRTGGCPACMLAVLRQSGVTDFHIDRRGKQVFDYQQEVDRVRAQEREAMRGDMW